MEQVDHDGNLEAVYPKRRTKAMSFDKGARIYQQYTTLFRRLCREGVFLVVCRKKGWRLRAGSTEEVNKESEDGRVDEIVG